MRNVFKIAGVIAAVLLIIACSNQKNTKKNRIYHEINTRYNIHYNAEIAYEEALKNKIDAYEDNLSRMISMYPVYPEDQAKLGTFETTIDKSVKAIKLHSIQTKPERNPNKKRDIKYQEWLQQKEFNPFMKNVWLLMAKAEYQSLDYIKAIATFSYIARMYKHDADVVAESYIWIAMAYTQMGWVYEAESTFHKLNLLGPVPNKFKDLYAKAYANLLLRGLKYEEAIPYLEEAIKTSGGMERTRFRYLLGQVQAKLGNRQAAYEAFSSVQGLSTPHNYTLNSKLQQASFVDINNPEATKRTLSSLNKMTKQTKNEEYLDQIYYAMGNIYWAKKDTTDAIKYYTDAIEKSKRSGYDKGLALVALGDIYFDRKNFVKAQPLYPEALGALGKDFERYAEISLRSEVLDELVVYAEALHLQDSLQTLAKMPEDARLAAIEKIIEEQKKKDKDEEKEREAQNWRDQNEEERPDMVAGFPSERGSSDKGSSFYFHNKQTVAQGKTSFKKLWGNRKLEDNWRRSEKISTAFNDDFATQEDGTQLPSDSTRTEGAEGQAKEQANATNDDKYSAEYYLAQLPLTPEAIEKSNEIIEDAYYNMGLIYKNKLGDTDLAIDAFDTDLRRFPDTPNKEEIYYQFFLIYSQLGDKSVAELYRSKLIAEFPKGDYAIALSDPNYEWNMRNMERLENDLYNATYQAYLDNNPELVRTNYETARNKYPLSKLIPKFMFVNALSYAQTGNPTEFTDNLKELVSKYPDADVTALATDMLKGVQDGKALVAGNGMKGMIWNIAFAGEDFSGTKDEIGFVDNRDEKHRMFLIFDPTKINKNNLLYDVADYNFSNFILKTFDMSFSDMKPMEALQIQGFDNLNEILEYTNKAFEDSLLVSSLDSSIILLPISESNYSALSRGYSVGEYTQFVGEVYPAEFSTLIAYWKQQMQEAEEEQKEREKQKAQEAEAEQKQLTRPQAEEKLEDINPDDIRLERKPATSTPLASEEKALDEAEGQKTQPKSQDEGLETIISDDMVDDVVNTAKDIGSTISKIADNPVDGLKGFINSIKNKPKLTKEEKEEQKREKERVKEREKQRKENEKAINDSIRLVEKARQDSIKLEEKERIEMERAVVKAREDAKKDAIKAKEDARKERERELKAKEQERKDRLKQQEKDRNDRLKQREAERKAKLKAKDEERKEKEKERRQRERSR